MTVKNKNNKWQASTFIMAFLLRSIIGGGSGLGGAVSGILSPVKNVAGSLFSAAGSVVSSVGGVFSSLIGGARTAANVIASPFRIMSSPMFWVPVGLMAVGGVYILTSSRPR